MKKIMAILIALSLLVVPAMAQNTSGVKIHSLIILGKGIAASQSDPMNFMIVKLGIGKATIPNGTEISTGVLKLDDEKYRLRNIEIGEGEAKGRIYQNESNVGSFDVSSVMKGDTEIWAGTIDLNGKTYNTYVIEGARPVRPSELKDKVANYCKENPGDQNCKKVANYCQNNPEDSRCKALFRAYCLKTNMEDTRCRQEFANWCKENPANKYCVSFELKRAKAYCEEHSDSILCKRIANKVVDFCKANPDNDGCLRAKQVIQDNPRLLQRAQDIRSVLSNIKTNVSVVAHKGIESKDVEGE